MQTASSSTQDLVTAAVATSGRLTIPATKVLDGWATVTEIPRLVSFNGQRVVVFTGQQDTVTANPLSDGTARTASSSDGRSWTLNPDSLGLPKAGAYGLDAVQDGESLLTAGNFSSTPAVQYNEGFYPDNPLNFATLQAPGAGCCAYSTALAKDRKTGTIWAAYYSNSAGSSLSGIQYAPLKPSVGAVRQAPGSSGSDSADQRVAMTARPGGGVWIAYKVGFAPVTGIRLFDVTSGRSLTVPGSAGARRLSLAAAADGRLWVSWVDAREGLRLARTNPAATGFGVTRVVPLPKGITGVWHVASDAAGTVNVLDMVITGRTASGVVNVFHGQALAPLKVAGKTPPRRGKPFVVVVTEAGAPVQGATVTFLGRKAITGKAGTVTFAIPKSTAVSVRPVSASKPGFWPAVAKVSITR